MSLQLSYQKLLSWWLSFLVLLLYHFDIVLTYCAYSYLSNSVEMCMASFLFCFLMLICCSFYCRVPAGNSWEGRGYQCRLFWWWWDKDRCWHSISWLSELHHLHWNALRCSRPVVCISVQDIHKRGAHKGNGQRRLDAEHIKQPAWDN